LDGPHLSVSRIKQGDVTMFSQFSSVRSLNPVAFYKKSRRPYWSPHGKPCPGLPQYCGISQSNIYYAWLVETRSNSCSRRLMCT